jgi:hypothetical protein
MSSEDAAGFIHEETLLRSPIPQVEVGSQRAYIFAKQRVQDKEHVSRVTRRE